MIKYDNTQRIDFSVGIWFDLLLNIDFPSLLFLPDVLYRFILELSL